MSSVRFFLDWVLPFILGVGMWRLVGRRLEKKHRWFRIATAAALGPALITVLTWSAWDHQWFPIVLLGALAALIVSTDGMMREFDKDDKKGVGNAF